MKIHEILTEADKPADFKKAAPDQVAAIKGAMSIPAISQNKSNGNPYMGYRFGLAMAGAPDYPTAAAGAVAGDPLLSSYTDEELEIINMAAKAVGAGKVRRLSSNRSEELSNVNKSSPVAKKKKNKYGV